MLYYDTVCWCLTDMRDTAPTTASRLAVEFYFADSNLPFDKYVSVCMHASTPPMTLATSTPTRPHCHLRLISKSFSTRITESRDPSENAILESQYSCLFIRPSSSWKYFLSELAVSCSRRNLQLRRRRLDVCWLDCPMWWRRRRSV